MAGKRDLARVKENVQPDADELAEALHEGLMQGVKLRNARDRMGIGFRTVNGLLAQGNRGALTPKTLQTLKNACDDVAAAAEELKTEAESTLAIVA